MKLKKWGERYAGCDDLDIMFFDEYFGFILK